MIKLCIILITIVTLVKGQLGIIDSAFINFKADFGKSYSSPIEESYRKGLFAAKLRSILAFNAQSGNTYTKGINEMSDLTNEEVKEYTLGDLDPDDIWQDSRYENSNKAAIAEAYIKETDSEQFDWRDYGAVTPVKRQVGALEGMTKIKKGTLTSLSEQELVDCFRKSCKGQHTVKGFEYVLENGISLEECYPYESTDKKARKCRKCKTNGTTISGHGQVTRNDENELKRTLNDVGPISLSMCWPESCGDYKSGIYNDRECILDDKKDCPSGWHALTLVGYGSEDGNDFWIIKNSWGERYGEKGYIRMIRGQDMCMLTRHARYPIA